MRMFLRRSALLLALASGFVVPLPTAAKPMPMPMPEKAPLDMSKPMPAMEVAPPATAAPQEPPPQSARGTRRPTLAEQSAWPSATADDGTITFLQFDNLEYQGGKPQDSLRWDFLGWRGGDTNRFWFKSEGRQIISKSQGSEYEVQALYGRLIAPFFDLQAGVRFDRRVERDNKPSRVYAVLGLQGLAPYRFDIEPTLFLSQKGKLSARFTGTYDVLFSQRLVLQPRLEFNVAAQKDEEIGTGAGFNDAEVGLRLRYEVRREFAPYIGVTWRQSFGATRTLTRRDGGDPNQFIVLMGVHAWY